MSTFLNLPMLQVISRARNAVFMLLALTLSAGCELKDGDDGPVSVSHGHDERLAQSRRYLSQGNDAPVHQQQPALNNPGNVVALKHAMDEAYNAMIAANQHGDLAAYQAAHSRFMYYRNLLTQAQRAARR